MVQMQLAAETGKNGLADFAKVSGMTASEFQGAWKTDAASAIQAFIGRPFEDGRVRDQRHRGRCRGTWGITEVRLRDTLLNRATNANELFGKALSMANGEWKRNTALTKEASTRYGHDPKPDHHPRQQGQAVRADGRRRPLPHHLQYDLRRGRSAGQLHGA